MNTSLQIPVFDAARILAFIGDLSMGQPVDHSARTAWLATRIAATLGLDEASQASARYVALLRWSGCTANAPEFSELMGDDVAGRNSMLSSGLPQKFKASMGLIAQIQCEVSGHLAARLGLPDSVQRALSRLFESLDDASHRLEIAGVEISSEVFIVAAASDFEIYSRVYGLERASTLIASRAGSRYSSSMADAVRLCGSQWLETLATHPECIDVEPVVPGLDAGAPLDLIADVVDLKVPWMSGLSRRVASAAVECGRRLGLDDSSQRLIHRAALIHGIGRASVPNSAWNDPRSLRPVSMEQLRLVSYWTARAGHRVISLRDETELASFIDERIDGSGFFRGQPAAAACVEARVLAAAAHRVMLQTSRPGRVAMSNEEACNALREEAQLGRLDEGIVDVLCGSTPAQVSRPATSLLTEREISVLTHISRGANSKEAAKALEISPSTVRTHVENIFRKLGCSTRAAATLKAMAAGLL